MDVPTNLRLPSFLEGVVLERKVASAGFLGEHRRALANATLVETKPLPIEPAPPPPMEELVEVAPPVAAELVEAMPEPPPPPPPPIIDMSRMEAAIDRLRLLSERLAADAKSDALELGLMIARKVVEGELAVNADRLIGVIKSAVARVGESRRIVVHLNPEDAELLHAGAAAPAGTPPALERLGRGVAKVEVLADPELGRGDCVVEGDHLSVDARLDSKFAEIRRALLEAAWEEET